MKEGTGAVEFLGFENNWLGSTSFRWDPAVVHKQLRERKDRKACSVLLVSGEDEKQNQQLLVKNSRFVDQ